jgi:hypothetical protein
MHAGLVTGFLALATLLGDVSAQQVRPSEERTRLDRTLRALRDSQMVRTVTIGAGRLQGRVLEHSDTLLMPATEPGTARVYTSTIDSLWVRGNNVTKGLLWGAGVGALGGVAVGLLLEPICEYGCSGIIPVVGLLGLGAGAGIGALIGATVPKWHRRWP